MAIRFDTSGEGLIRTSDLLSHNADFTMAGWFRMTTDTNTFATLFGIFSAGGEYDALETRNDGTTLLIVSNRTTFSQSSTILNMSVGTWYFIALTRSGNTLTGYVITQAGSVSSQTLAKNTSANAPSANTVGQWSDNTELDNGRVMGLKFWSAALTQAELLNEMQCLLPRRFTNLYGFWPCFPGSGERTRDYSGYGRNWTESGTVSDEDPAPVPWGAGLHLMLQAAAAGGNNYTQSVSGSATPSGGLTRQTNKSPVGTLTSAGAILRTAAKNLAGTLTSAGTIARAISKAFTGTLTSSGAVTTIRTYLVSLAGSLFPTGGLTRLTGKPTAGTLTSSGQTTKHTAKTLSGGLTSAGTLATLRTYLVALGGTITSAGALLRRTNKAQAGTLAPSGSLARNILKALAGSLNPAGVMTTLRTFLVALAGTLTSAGGLSRQTNKATAGTLTSAGTQTRLIAKLTAGALAFSGAVNKAVSKAFAGVLSFVGTVAGVLSGTSVVPGQVRLQLASVTLLTVTLADVSPVELTLTEANGLTVNFV